MSSDVGSDARERVVVIGAGELISVVVTNCEWPLTLPGVIGLTTAVRIQETGRYDVNIVAEHFHSDTKKTVEYTSYWAVSALDHIFLSLKGLNKTSQGAHHVGFPDDTSRQQRAYLLPITI